MNQVQEEPQSNSRVDNTGQECPTQYARRPKSEWARYVTKDTRSNVSASWGTKPATSVSRLDSQYAHQVSSRYGALPVLPRANQGSATERNEKLTVTDAWTRCRENEKRLGLQYKAWSGNSTTIVKGRLLTVPAKLSKTDKIRTGSLQILTAGPREKEQRGDALASPKPSQPLKSPSRVGGWIEQPCIRAIISTNRSIVRLCVLQLISLSPAARETAVSNPDTVRKLNHPPGSHFRHL